MKHSTNKSMLWRRKPVQLAAFFLLLAAVIVGGITLYSAHAASTLDGRYNLRAITTSGPSTGTYITGAMVIQVNGTTIRGTICGLKSPQRCAAITGSTPDSVHVTLTIGRVKPYPAAINLTGIYKTTGNVRGGINGFMGTYTMGASSGTWEAYVGTAPKLSNSWSLFGIVTSGPDLHKQFHGTLTLTQKPNGDLVGTYCPISGTCQAVTGGQANNGNFFFYVDVPVLGQIFRLRGTFVSGNASTISGQFVSLAPTKNADRGYWLGH